MKTRSENHKRILVIVPAFNEENTILDVVQSTLRIDGRYDVLVINDNSSDQTESILREHQINHISLPINLGIGGSVQTGFIYACENDYDVAVQVDGDGQHPPEQIPCLIEPILKDEADAVIGSRYLGTEQIVSSLSRRMGGGLLANIIFFATGKKITDPTSGFRAFNRKAIQNFCQYYPQEYPEPISAIELIEKGLRVKEVPVKMNERQYGRSSITGLDTIFYMIKVIFAIIIVKLRGK